jgi:hypothetical protein
MTNRRWILGILFCVLFALVVSIGSKALFAATCTGADPCHACKNCKYCKHCAKDRGKCGVCK